MKRPLTFKYAIKVLTFIPLVWVGCMVGILWTGLEIGFCWGQKAVSDFSEEIMERANERKRATGQPRSTTDPSTP